MERQIELYFFGNKRHGSGTKTTKNNQEQQRDGCDTFERESERDEGEKWKGVGEEPETIEFARFYPPFSTDSCFAFHD
uniref:Uncharacterized protein n=1 Tax=Onchocerca volvulus TaxID=6282 RepID=A0A8R1XZW5_ONCVO